MSIHTVDDTAKGTKVVGTNTLRTNIIIQNTGNEPVLLKLDEDVTTEDYDHVLSAETTPRAGAGGQLELRNYKGSIKAMTEQNSSTVVIMEVF